MEILTKIDRFFAWILFAGMLLYFLSGYGMTKGIISSSFATSLHLDILTYIVFIAFIGHTAFAVHLAFKRWRWWNAFSITLLIVFYLTISSGLVYFDIFNNKTSQPSEEVNNASIKPIPSAITSSTIKTFTLSELAKYNGKNNQPAYVAVDGDVYDLTSVFEDGKHFSHFAGTELTNAFYTKHAKSALAKYLIVGKLVK